MSIAETLIWAYVLALAIYQAAIMLGTAAPRHRLRRSGKGAPSFSVGIIVPAYNELHHSAYIVSAIDTAREIGEPLVVVDDGSIDNSSEVLAELCAVGGARLNRHEDNRGKAIALNTGLDALTTDLVVTLDADSRIMASDILSAIPWFMEGQIGAVALTSMGSAHRG